jgi:hypothetical protein
VNHRDLQRLEALAPTDEQLLEARESADLGLRLVFPQLFESLEREQAAEEETPATIDHETATAIGADLLELRERVLALGLKLPLEGNADLHLAFNAMLNEIDRLGGVIAERWGE